MIYFIQEAGNSGAPIKIGFTSSSAESRLASLQTGYPAKLAVLASLDGDLAKESFLHRQWADLRLHGEWFKADEALLVYISEIKDMAPPADVIDIAPPSSPGRISSNHVFAAPLAYNHEWIENSGTTKICRRCGCIRYCCNCCTDGEEKYDRWSQKDRDWSDDVRDATIVEPLCDPSRPVPEWARHEREST